MTVTDSYQIGVDMGGTFTDVVVINQTGELWTDKADTTPENLIIGLEESLQNVSSQMGIPLSALLNNCKRFVHGTTIVTNSIAELKGAKTGLLTTKGMRDTLRIARSPRTAERDHHKQQNMPDVVDRQCIVEIDERIDKNGEVIVRLNERQVEEAVDTLVKRHKVEAIAVCFLWSFLNNGHEKRVKEIIESKFPDIYVTISCEVYPVMREYERMVTTVLNAFTGPKVARYVDQVQKRLGELGLKTPVAFVHSYGGSLSADEVRVRPIALVDSGPVGGVLGSNHLGETQGLENIITGDMGGTSFDCSIIVKNSYTQTQRVYLNRLLTGLSKIDVTAIGSGGGSIAWLDSRGVLQVGPQSAGADPGPACYGRGGEEPTVTDAAVLLGLIDPDNFLGGRKKLFRDKSLMSFKKLSSRLSMSEIEVAAAVYELVVASMSNAVRGVSVEKGHDPSEFTFIAYGGALPLFVAEICQELGIRNAIVPNTSAVFSAQGLLAGDDVRNYVQSCFWRPGQGTDHINNILSQMEARARESLHNSGFIDEEIEIRKFGDFKFDGQIFDLSVPLPDGELKVRDIESIAENFQEIYEAEFGPGTAWVESPVIMMALRLTGVGKVKKYHAKQFDLMPSPVTPKSHRSIFVPKERKWITAPIYDDSDMRPGCSIQGPAIIERSQTTMFIPDNVVVSMDNYRNYKLVL